MADFDPSPKLLQGFTTCFTASTKSTAVEAVGICFRWSPFVSLSICRPNTTFESLNLKISGLDYINL